MAGLERLDAIATERGFELQPDAPLAPLTTLRVGGPADRLAAPVSVDDLVALVVDGTRLRAEAGASMTGLAKRCAREGLAGFDWAISIPGSFGGAIWANAGAHEGEMAQVVAEVEV